MIQLPLNQAPFSSSLSLALSSAGANSFSNSPTMEPPPSTTGAVAVASAPHLHYPVSVNSSPLSPNTNPGDEKPIPPISAAGKLRLMCSYGGHIITRPRDKSLCYVGGETRIVVTDRRTTLSDLSNRLSKTLLHSQSFTLKYQLPNEDLDSLISVTTDDDLENMIDEYNRLTTTTATAGKSSRLRLFLFPEKPDSESSIGSLIENSTKSEEWFLNVLNGSNIGFPNSSSVNCLLRLDDDVPIDRNLISVAKEFDSQLESIENFKRDVQSVPDTPLMETRSSCGSVSSSPSVVNLPPIRVQVEDQKVGVGGFEEQFSQMSFGTALSSPATVSTGVVAATAVSGVPVVVSGEYSNWVQAQVELQTQAQPFPPQSLPKSAGGLDLPSPDSVSSDGSVTNPLSHQRTMIYQDPIVGIPSGNNRIPNSIDRIDQKSSDPNSQVQLQQVQDSNYVFPTQFEQQQQQFIQSGSQYIHHNPSGSVPITSYYPVYPSPHQHHHAHHTIDPQYPFYYVPARQTQTSNLPVQQPNRSEPNSPAPYTRSQTPSQPATYNPTRNAPPLVQVPSNQHQPQYLGFSQIHHSSQSIAPNSVVNPNYAYEFSDPSQAQMYYAQYQTMTADSGIGLSEASSQLSTANMKQQQIRTSQPQEVRLG